MAINNSHVGRNALRLLTPYELRLTAFTFAREIGKRRIQYCLKQVDALFAHGGEECSRDGEHLRP